VILEALIISILALLFSLAIVTLSLTLLDSWLTAEYGLFLSNNVLSPDLLILSSIIIGATLITALVPGLEAYKKVLHSQLSSR
jgi:putative ABC transport system permease protein